MAAVFRVRSTHEMPKGIVKDALNNLGNKLDAIFASLPRTRVLNLEHFYANKFRVLKVPKKIVNDVVNNLGKRLDALFASLPRSRGMTLDTFYVKKLRVLKMPESTRTKLREKEVRGSASHGVSEENEPQSSETERFSWGTFPK